MIIETGKRDLHSLLFVIGLDSCLALGSDSTTACDRNSPITRLGEISLWIRLETATQRAKQAVEISIDALEWVSK